MQTGQARKPSVFISYSHLDERWKDRLEGHLRVLQHEGILSTWTDRDIAAGEDWQQKIQAAMDGAALGVLLVSRNSLTSQFILRQEVAALLRRKREQGLTIFPIIVEPCPWQTVGWLQAMQCRLSNGKPLALRRRPQADETLAGIATEIAEILARPPGEDRPSSESGVASRGPDDGDLGASVPATRTSFITDPADPLLEASFGLYDQLFEATERSHPEHIKTWLQESLYAEQGLTENPWREMYAVEAIGERIVGVSWLTCQKERAEPGLPPRWAYGGYFGVLPDYRSGLQAAERLWKSVKQKVKVDFPRAEALLFEVEPVDVGLLSSFGSELQRAEHVEAPAPDVLRELWRLRRVHLYDMLHGRVLLRADGRPAVIVQPSMRDELAPCNEKDYWLMSIPLTGIGEAPLAALDALRFLYGELYRDSFCGESAVQLRDYAVYLHEVQLRSTRAVGAGAGFGRLAFDGGLWNLIRVAKRSGWWEHPSH